MNRGLQRLAPLAECQWRKVHVTKNLSPATFFNIFGWNFQNLSEIEFLLKLLIFFRLFFGKRTSFCLKMGVARFKKSVRNFLWELMRLLSIDWLWEITVLGLICHFRFFGPYVGPKMGGPCPPIRVGGLKTQPKSWHTGWTFWVHHYLEILFQKFWGTYPL